MKTLQEKQKGAFEVLKGKLGYKNPMQVPRILKVVIGVGTGSFKDKKKLEVVADRLMKITGQKAAPRGAKKSIATYKTRIGDVVGTQVTLRGKRMTGFLEKLINIALPRTKDFRGISQTAVDEMGNITIGIREHTIFPETSDEDLKDVFGLGITIATTAGNAAEGQAYFEYIGIPFKKDSKSRIKA